ncbi:MAG: response regulator transcription factor, partial [Anaerolineales bacterium]|nr:response regulator transcription factor [Anaerolineales bacterium]
RLPIMEPGTPIQYPLGLLYNSALRITLYQAAARGETAHVEPAIAFADQVFTTMMENGYLPLALETLLLRSQLHALLGNETASQADLTQALELGAPEGFVSVFIDAGPPVAEAIQALLDCGRLESVRLDYVRTILTAFAELQKARDGGQAAQTAAVLVAPLTERELDVLRLMADGLKYAEIAEKLFVSLNTVRSHVKAVYGKLNVDKRSKAVARARELHIL